MATDKITELVTAFQTDAENIKAAQKVQRQRIKNIEAVMALGLLTDEQTAQVAALLPKKRAPKGETPAAS